MNRAIRVLVANRPRLMREALLGTLSDQPWIEVVGEVSNDADIPDFVSKTLPDLLVIAVDGPRRAAEPVRCAAAKASGLAHYCGRALQELRRLLLGLAGYSLERH